MLVKILLYAMCISVALRARKEMEADEWFGRSRGFQDGVGKAQGSRLQRQTLSMAAPWDVGVKLWEGPGEDDSF